jgi:hypothetical protein
LVERVKEGWVEVVAWGEEVGEKVEENWVVEVWVKVVVGWGEEVRERVEVGWGEEVEGACWGCTQASAL